MRVLDFKKSSLFSPQLVKEEATEVLKRKRFYSTSILVCYTTEKSNRKKWIVIRTFQGGTEKNGTIK